MAHHDEAGIEGGKTISMGKLSAKVRYTGCNGDSYNWSVELVRYTPVTTKVSVRNFTDKLVKVASNNEDFVKNPALLYYKYNEHLNSGYEDKRAPRSTDCDEQGGAIRRFRRITMRPSTWEVASGSGQSLTTPPQHSRSRSSITRVRTQQTGPSQPLPERSPNPSTGGNRMVTLSRSTG